MPPAHRAVHVQTGEGRRAFRRHRASFARNQGPGRQGGDGGQGLPLAEAALVKLGQQLKAACGSGGTVKDGVIEVQGDHCERVIGMLKEQGHTVKRAGG